ncbi:hypothetical protein Q3G72_008579 [Acer saccharum]|nr:hypothetical protein Q3G72_008579 [Acer saccharum]
MHQKDSPDLQIVKADVTEGSEKLAQVIGDDSEAVICATGFRPGWDLFAPWKNQARREAMAARKAGTPRAAPALSIGDGAIPPTSSAAFAAPKVTKARRTMM